MAKPSRTQTRLQQLTGSFGNVVGKIRDDIGALAMASIQAPDLTGSLGHMASALKRIHGAPTFSEATAGKFYHDIVFNANGTRDLGDTTNNAAEIHAQSLKSNAGLHLTAPGLLRLTGSSTGNNAIQMKTTAGGIDIDSLGGPIKLTSAPNHGILLESSGAGDISLDSDDTMVIKSVNALSVNSTASAIKIGNLDYDRAIEIGLDGIRVIDIGTQLGASSNAASTKVALNAVVIDIDGGATGVKIDALDAGTIDIGNVPMSLDRCWCSAWCSSFYLSVMLAEAAPTGLGLWLGLGLLTSRLCWQKPHPWGVCI